jgi:hypothetical protein
MKNERSDVKNYSYLPLLSFVTTLSLLLTAFLVTDSFGQTSENTYRNQASLEVEVTEQTDSPLLIVLSNVDNSAESYQIINFTIQNVSSKNIRAYVTLNSFEKSGGASGISTSIFDKPFEPRNITQDSHTEARANIHSTDKLYLTLDYVEFDDGSSWGKDSEKQSEYIAGTFEGQRNAVIQIKDLLIAQNKNALSDFLKQQPDAVKPPVDESKGTEKWRRGFSSGYKSILFRLKIAYEKNGVEAVAQKLEDMEKSEKTGKK